MRTDDGGSCRKEGGEKRREKVADWAQLTQIVAIVMSGYIGSQETNRKRRRKRKKSARSIWGKRLGVVATGTSSDNESSSSSSDNN